MGNFAFLKFNPCCSVYSRTAARQIRSYGSSAENPSAPAIGAQYLNVLPIMETFYFTFIYKNASALQVLGAEAFYDEYVAPTLTDFISRRFEGICRDYFSLQVRSGKLKGVRNIGSYYYDDPVHRKNGEFDVALELADGYAIYEAKYYAQPMTLDEIHREAQQVANIKELAVKQLGFIAINGFVEQEKPYTYLDGNDIFAGM